MIECKARALGALLGVAGALTLAACGGEETTTVTQALRDGRSIGADLPQGSEPATIDPARFTAEIDNPYWPMAPGTRWVYRETGDEGVEQKVVVKVLDRTKRIANGVEARVVRDTVTEDGELIEDTFDWYAQDTDGNVWYMGEDTAEYENGKVVTRAGSFEAGVDGAEAGVIMPADPEPGMTYRQEYYEGEAEDRGEVVSLDSQVQTATGHYTDVVMTRDVVPLEPKVEELKLYARGVGPVLVLGISGGLGAEELIRFEPGR